MSACSCTCQGGTDGWSDERYEQMDEIMGWRVDEVKDGERKKGGKGKRGG